MSHDDIKEIMKRCVEEIKGENVMEIKQEDPLQNDHPVQEHLLEYNDNEDLQKYKDDIDIDDHGMLCELKQEEFVDPNIYEKPEGWDVNSEKQFPNDVKDEPSDKEQDSSVYETPRDDEFPIDNPSEGNNLEDEAPLVLCPKCPKKLRNKISLRKHMYNAHSGSRFCEPCQRSFERVSLFARHNREVHKKIRSAVCSNCGKSFTRNGHLTLHEARCLDKGNGANRSFDCQYCPKKYYSKSAKMLHERKFHKEDGSLIVTEKIIKEDENICKVCQIPKRFISKKTLRQHKLLIHAGRTDIIKSSKKVIKLSDVEVRNQESKKADCELCSEVFPCEQDVQDHMKAVHSEDRFHKCKQCPKKYSKSVLLKNHVRNVHRDGKFACPECGKKSKHKQVHLKHLEIHGKEKATERHRRPLDSLKKSQRYVRLKEEAKINQLNSP